MLQITGADLGWHLQNCHAPPWYNLQKPTWEQLLSDPKWIPKLGIRGWRESNEINRRLKQRLNQGRAAAIIELQLALQVLTYIQVEPGDTIADHLAAYARRINCLINVSCDGYLQIWRPDYNREPLFSIEYHDVAEFEKKKNNVLDCTMSSTIDGRYTQVSCIWERLDEDLTPNPTNQNFGKYNHSFINEHALPFYRLFVFRTATYTTTRTPKHRRSGDITKASLIAGKWFTPSGDTGKNAGQQRAYWWESDQMCAVNDTVNGIRGNFTLRRCVATETSAEIERSSRFASRAYRQTLACIASLR